MTTGTDTSEKAPKMFTLDGETVNLPEFFVLNDIDPEDANRIGRLEPGEWLEFGGGAGAIFILRREE